MAKQLTVRNVPDSVAEKLDAMSREQGESVNTIVELENGDRVEIEFWFLTPDS